MTWGEAGRVPCALGRCWGDAVRVLLEGAGYPGEKLGTWLGFQEDAVRADGEGMWERAGWLCPPLSTRGRLRSSDAPGPRCGMLGI